MTKRTQNHLTALFVLLAMAITLTGCFGSKARTEVLIPTIEVAWVNVEADAARGAELSTDPASATLEDVAAFGQAITDRDTLAIVAQWPAVKAAAEDGIDERLRLNVISLGVAASLRERIRLMDESVSLIAERPF